MSSPPEGDRAARGRALLAARARRIALLRRRVVAATLATFALAWGAIAWQGSLGTKTGTATAQVRRAAATATASASASATPSATATPDTTGSSSSDLTTGQS
jgi:hypothetical protein